MFGKNIKRQQNNTRKEYVKNKRWGSLLRFETEDNYSLIGYISSLHTSNGVGMFHGV